MKLTFYRAETPNFGDDLNNVMWEALIKPGFFDSDESTLFLGIGSILWDFYPKDAKKIVMGAGYGGYTAKPDMHEGNWDVAFVRGPRTAKILNLDPKSVITDSAILTRFLNLPEQQKKYKVSFMPHWQSIPRGNWKKVCEQAGIHYLDPTNPDVMTVLNEIQQSELVITEAMHGAILSDTMRVPWLALEPIAPVHRNKWYDWSESLNIKLNFNKTPNSSVKDFYSHLTGNNGLGPRSEQIGKLLKFSDSFFVDNAAKKLLKLVNASPQMSADSIFLDKSDMALEKLSQYAPIKSL